MSGNEANPAPDEDFDGHLEKPVSEMSVAERLEWAWEMMLLLHWARHGVRRGESGSDRESGQD